MNNSTDMTTSTKSISTLVRKLRSQLGVLVLFTTATMSMGLASSLVHVTAASAVNPPLIWSTPQRIDNATDESGGAGSLSCVSSSFCISVGGNAILRWNGSTWTAPLVIDNGQHLTSVSCVSTSFCAAVDGIGNATMWNGTIWSYPKLIDPNIVFSSRLESVSCASATFCVAVDTTADVITWNGNTWQLSQPFGSGGSTIGTEVSCPEISFCMWVIGGDFVYWNGTSWSSGKSIPNFGFVSSLSCISSTFCMVVDTTGRVALGGESGFAYGGIPQPVPISFVSCASTNYCLLVGNGAGGGGWEVWNGSTLTNGTVSHGYASVSCAPSGFCMVMGAGYIDGTDLPGIGGAPNPIQGPWLSSTSCVSVIFCQAVDYQGNVLTWNGSTWSSPQLIDSNGSLTSVSCVSATFCMAVDEMGDAFFYNVSSWSGFYNVDPNQNLDSVSCVITSFCIATDGSGHYLTWNGTSWSAPQNFDSSNYVTSVSCTSPAFCMAVDGSGYYLTWNGSSWSVPQSIFLATYFLSSVSCALSNSYGTQCVAVDQLGDASDFNGSTWTTIGSSNQVMSSVSCIYPPSSTLFCMAVDSYGTFMMAPLPLPSVTSVTPPEGPLTGGTQVIITGANFYSPTSFNGSTGSTSVTFGGIAATNVVVNSTTSISATVPAGVSAGTVGVVVTTPAGSNYQQAGSFTYPVPPTKYFPLTPSRIVDTRLSSGYFGAGQTLGPMSTFNLPVSGNYGIPKDATAVALNVTATNTTSSGYLVVYPDAANLPGSSNLNWLKGQTEANLVEVNIGSDGKVDFYNRFGNTDLVVDLEGYYEPSIVISGLYRAISPTRVCDTRYAGNQCYRAVLNPISEYLTPQIAGTNDAVPIDAEAVVINLTATDTTNASYLTVTPDYSTQSNTSSLNWSGANETVSNRVIVKLSSSGSILLSNFAGSTDVIVDVVGYFTGSTSISSGSSFTGVTPVRIADTRAGSGLNDQNSTLAPGASVTVYVAGLNGVPTGATAAVINVTATNTTAPGYLSVTPTGGTTTSDVNWMGPNLSVANVDIATLSSTGSITITNGSNGSVDIVLDLFGYMS